MKKHSRRKGGISRWFARWRAPDMVDELSGFLAHERRHRDLFGAELARRGRRRCRSWHLCGLGGFALLRELQALHAVTMFVQVRRPPA